MPRCPASPKTYFILGQPLSLSANKVVRIAAERGIHTNKTNVLRVRRLLRAGKYGPLFVPH